MEGCYGTAFSQWIVRWVSIKKRQSYISLRFHLPCSKLGIHAKLSNGRMMFCSANTKFAPSRSVGAGVLRYLTGTQIVWIILQSPKCYHCIVMKHVMKAGGGRFGRIQAELSSDQQLLFPLTPADRSQIDLYRCIGINKQNNWIVLVHYNGVPTETNDTVASNSERIEAVFVRRGVYESLNVLCTRKFFNLASPLHPYWYVN